MHESSKARLRRRGAPTSKPYPNPSANYLRRRGAPAPASGLRALAHDLLDRGRGEVLLQPEHVDELGRTLGRLED